MHIRELNFSLTDATCYFCVNMSSIDFPIDMVASCHYACIYEKSIIGKLPDPTFIIRLAGCNIINLKS